MGHFGSRCGGPQERAGRPARFGLKPARAPSSFVSVLNASRRGALNRPWLARGPVLPVLWPLLSLSLLLALPSRAAADGISWTAKKPLPTPRAYLGAVVLQGKIWAVGGYSGSNLANLDVYDPVTDTWSAKAPMP